MKFQHCKVLCKKYRKNDNVIIFRTNSLLIITSFVTFHRVYLRNIFYMGWKIYVEFNISHVSNNLLKFLRIIDIYVYFTRIHVTSNLRFKNSKLYYFYVYSFIHKLSYFNTKNVKYQFNTKAH